MGRVAAWIALLCACAFAVFALVDTQRRYNNVHNELKEAKSRVDSLLVIADSIAKLRRERVVVAYKTKRIYDTVRVRDTLVRNDTVFIPREVADQAVETCTDALKTCEVEVGALREVIAQKDTVAEKTEIVHTAELSSAKKRWAIIGGALSLIASLLLIR